jgi:hypothetical protein
MEILDLIQKLQGLGVAGLALLFLWLTNKYHLNERQKQEDRHREEMKATREEHKDRCDELNLTIDAKNEVIGKLSLQLRDASQQSLTDMERHLTRQGEREVARERDNAQTAASITQLASSIDGLTAEVRATRG